MDSVYGDRYGRRWQEVVDQHKPGHPPAGRAVATPVRKRVAASSVLPHGYDRLGVEEFEYDNSLTYISSGRTWQTLKQPLPPGAVDQLEVFRFRPFEERPFCIF